MRFIPGLTFLVLAGPVPAADPPVGFLAKAEVRQPTRLDWEFIASGFGKDAAKLPADYDSTKQRFQLYVPKDYAADRAWPLVVFVSPGDDPLGWRYWQKLCERSGLLFCAAYGAGNNCPAGKRVRIVLDVFDQVRRDYRIDAERTYFTGFSGGGRIACTLAFSLPEYCGGVMPVCGTNPPARLDYLRHRAADRLSVALVTGETDFNRVEHESYMLPLLSDTGVRARVWTAPKVGHAVPGEAVLDEALKWLEEDLPRRREDVKKRQLLARPDDDGIDATKRAARLLEAAEGELKDEARVWRGVTILQGVLARHAGTEAAGKARERLEALQKDARLLGLIDRQGGAEERTYLAAQARALEGFGKTAAAVQAWKMLAELHPQSDEGRKAREEQARLERRAEGQASLGLALAGQTAVVASVVPGGAADRAGVKAGDRLRIVGGAAVASSADLRAALAKMKPGEKVTLVVVRDGKAVELMATLK